MAGALRRPEACQAPYVAAALDWLAGQGAVTLEGQGGAARVTLAPVTATRLARRLKVALSRATAPL